MESGSHDDPGAGEQLGWFQRFARATSRFTGRPAVFAAAAALVAGWAVSGPLFGFSETWQLIINTTTTIITFLMVFLIQATQNRDNEAVHLKLDELIEATRSAREGMIDLEDQPDEVLQRLREEMRERREQAHRANGASREDAT
ncbi:MAG: low affinity iron permease family protein [Dehalococcoidia bacterium]